MLWLLWFRKIEWGKYVLTLLRKMKQSTIFKLTFWTVMFLLWINVDLLYCYDMSLENFTESTFFYIFLGAPFHSVTELLPSVPWHDVGIWLGNCATLALTSQPTKLNCYQLSQCPSLCSAASKLWSLGSNLVFSIAQVVENLKFLSSLRCWNGSTAVKVNLLEKHDSSVHLHWQNTSNTLQYQSIPKLFQVFCPCTPLRIFAIQISDIVCTAPGSFLV